MFSVMLELLLNRQFKDFFSFALRIDEDEKIKEIQSWGKMKDKRVRARKNLMFSCFYATEILVGYLRGAVSVLFAQLSLLFLKDNFFFKCIN